MFVGFFPALAPTLTLHQRLQLLACGAECKGLLVSMAFKLVLLAAGAWGVFLRRPRATMPRIFLFRAAILVSIGCSIFLCCENVSISVTEVYLKAIPVKKTSIYCFKKYIIFSFRAWFLYAILHIGSFLLYKLQKVQEHQHLEKEKH